MPYIKFDTPRGKSSNKGSCNLFVGYLLKEDKELKNEKEYFFNQKNDMINSSEVINSVDSNRQGLKKTEAKFYTGSLNFSEEELIFIDNDFKKIKEYTLEIFKQYAENFNKGLSIDDINWYAKIELNRYYKGDDEESKLGKVKQGEIKQGLNTHVHFIVGRKSNDGRKKLSPVTNHINTSKGAVKGGFNRDRFKMDGEALFDKMFYYNRDFTHKYFFLNHTKKHEKDFLTLKTRVEGDKIRYDQLSVAEKEQKLSKLINHMNKMLEKRKLEGLNRDMILEQAKKLKYNGAMYKSLINMNFKLHEVAEIPKDINRFVIDYTNFLNLPFNNLPVSLKVDKIERYIYMINRRIPLGLKKIDTDQILRFEKMTNYEGKSFKFLNDINSLIKKNDTIELISKLDNQSQYLDGTKKSEKINDETHLIVPEKIKVGEVLGKFIDTPSISSLFSDNRINNDSQSIEETEQDRIRNRRKKRRKNNLSQNI